MCFVYFKYGSIWIQSYAGEDLYTHQPLRLAIDRFNSLGIFSFFNTQFLEPRPTSKPSKLPKRGSEVYATELLLGPRYRGARSSLPDRF